MTWTPRVRTQKTGPLGERMDVFAHVEPFIPLPAVVHKSQYLGVTPARPPTMKNINESENR